MKNKDAKRLGRTIGMGLVLALSVGLPLAVLSCSSQTMSGVIYHYNTDILGMPTMVTDGNKNIVWKARYDEFGGLEKVTRTTQDSVTPLRFPGQYDDRDKVIVGEEGPYYNLHRYYDPMAGRYNTSDKTGSQISFNHPYSHISTNTYTYAANDPINLIDINGDNPVAAGAAIGAFAGPLGAAIGAAIGLVASAAAMAAVVCMESDQPSIPDIKTKGKTRIIPLPPGTNSRSICYLERVLSSLDKLGCTEMIYCQYDCPQTKSKYTIATKPEYVHIFCPPTIYK